MLNRLINDVVSLLDRRHRENKIRTELESISDKDLSEIGIRREDIGRIARESARQQ
jgi:uncharacterized protein YjiS (DUF1127 family)